MIRRLEKINYEKDGTTGCLTRIAVFGEQNSSTKVVADVLYVGGFHYDVIETSFSDAPSSSSSSPP